MADLSLTDGTSYLMQNITPGLMKMFEAANAPSADVLAHVLKSADTWSFVAATGAGLWVWPTESDGAVVVTETA